MSGAVAEALRMTTAALDGVRTLFDAGLEPAPALSLVALAGLTALVAWRGRDAGWAPSLAAAPVPAGWAGDAALGAAAADGDRAVLSVVTPGGGE